MSGATEGHECREPGEVRPGTAEVPAAERGVQVTPRRTIGVGALMVVIAFIGVILTVARWNLGVGISSAGLSCMALTWWCQMMAQRKADGQPMSLERKAVLLLTATGGVLLLSGVGVLVGYAVSIPVVWLVDTLHKALGDRWTAAVCGLLMGVFAAPRIWRHLRSKPRVDPGSDAGGKRSPR